MPSCSSGFCAFWAPLIRTILCCSRSLASVTSAWCSSLPSPLLRPFASISVRSRSLFLNSCLLFFSPVSLFFVVRFLCSFAVAAEDLIDLVVFGSFRVFPVLVGLFLFLPVSPLPFRLERRSSPPVFFSSHWFLRSLGFFLFLDSLLRPRISWICPSLGFPGSGPILAALSPFVLLSHASFWDASPRFGVYLLCCLSAVSPGLMLV